MSKGGDSYPNNLALACQPCNSAKGVATAGPDPQTDDEVPLFHPRQDDWDDHFRWSSTRLSILGTTATGRATVRRLRLNARFRGEARRRWAALDLIPAGS